ncbi:asparagine synthase (glutamine-hydrolyzing) [Desulfosediminicola flagellatus]|uniref:asparagine synthase (glutamine-hydrolyzing) n=1 Tax=Desulfosediminicola flagellatus TaxID=2569541 RepID=UPI0010AD922B|nr:asparagine synthase (glutamine-hydrolyzing) [Desulfosediminicola flagellatus]
MCGICGEVGNRYGYTVDADLIKRMSDSLAHRGPDDEGHYVNQMIGFGQRRLSIIDLQTGHQPLSNEDGTVWIVLNGEIYNYQALREQLLRRGHTFTTSSDTEVIVHLYEDEGVECIKQLKGMFSFALWDEKKRRLMLGRDRLGKKPLFYTQHEKSFLFASEIKALFCDNRIRRELNPSALHDFLSFKFIPQQEDLFKGICKLPPASYLTVNEGKVRIESYWNLTYKTDTSMSEEEALAKSEEVLSRAVKSRMISDVPIGAFLSSGLDSGMVVALMSQFSSSPVNSFSIGDQTEGFNELPDARKIADAFKTDHRELVVHPEAIKILPDLIYHLDGPFADVPALPMYYVAKLAREHVTVVLTGDGGDESFAGYDRYIANQMLTKYRCLPHTLRKKFIPAFLNLFEEKTARKSWRQTLRWFNTMSMMPENECYPRGISFFSFENEQKDQLYTHDFQQRVKGMNSMDGILSRYADDQIMDSLNKMMFCDLMIRVPEYSNVKVDRISMMHGLEARNPFLDHELVEFAATIPAKLKLKNGKRKYLLKQLAKKYLPAEIIKLPKQGFGSPINEWLRGELKDFSRDLLQNSLLVKDNLFNQKYINSLLADHAAKRMNNGNRIWSLINLEIWYRINFSQQQPEVAKENLKDYFQSLSA